MTEKIAEHQLLQSGLHQLNLRLSDDFIEKIIDFIAVLNKWNKVYNLIGTTDDKEIIIKHILDSLAVLPHLQGNQFIDVGSGGGFPGIPLALADPNRSWVLLDATEKRTRFLRQVQQTLSLDHIQIINARVEKYKPTNLFDGVITRAFSHLPGIIQYCRHLMSETGCLYAMKGNLNPEERDVLNHCVHECIEINVPYLHQVRQLVVIKNLGNDE